jgi:hypothetical protein
MELETEPNEEPEWMQSMNQAEREVLAGAQRHIGEGQPLSQEEADMLAKILPGVFGGRT